MPYTKQYTKAVEKVNGKDAWEDLPSKETPITAQCLDTIEQGVATNDERIVEMSQIYDKTAINMGRKSDTFGGTNSVAVGYDVAASGNYSSAVGHMSKAEGLAAHAEGRGTAASYDYAHAEGNETIANGEAAHAEGYKTTASGYYAHAEGKDTKATRMYGHAEGNSSESSGSSAHAEGESTVASGDYAHAEGSTTTASSSGAHAEGYKTVASNIDTHAEGCETIASGSYAHAEGYSTKASGASAHAEGSNTEAQGECSHVEGWGTVASPGSRQAHAEGLCTIASGFNQHVEGKYNVEDTDSKYAHIVGGGTADDNRKNIFTVDWNGNVEVAGDVKNGNGVSLDGLEAKVAGLPTSADTARTLSLDMDPATYVLTLSLLNADGETLSSGQVDLPLESMVVSASYENGKITLVLQSGDTLDVDVSEIVSGLVNNSRTIAGIDLKDDVTAKELKDALAYTAEEVGADPAGTARTLTGLTSYGGMIDSQYVYYDPESGGFNTVDNAGNIKNVLNDLSMKIAQAIAAVHELAQSASGNTGSSSPFMAYALCEDAGNVAAKTATIQNDPNWELKVGTVVAVKYSNINTATKANITLNINDTGAKQIFYSGKTLGNYVGHNSAIGRLKDMIVVYMYDGTYWAYVGHGEDYYEGYSVITGATAYANGTSGLVPRPTAGDNTKFLRGDGTWASPSETEYSVNIIGSKTSTDSIVVSDPGIYTIVVTKYGTNAPIGIYQYAYTYDDSDTFAGKTVNVTAAMSSTHGTVAVSTNDSGLKITSAKGYEFTITYRAF